MCNWAFLARPYGRAWDKYTIYLWTYFISTCKIKWIKLIQFISTFLRSNTAVMHETTRANMFPPVPVIPYYDIQLVIRGRRYAIRASAARKFLRRSLLQYYNCSFVIIGGDPAFQCTSTRCEASSPGDTSFPTIWRVQDRASIGRNTLRTTTTTRSSPY